MFFSFLTKIGTYIYLIKYLKQKLIKCELILKCLSHDKSPIVALSQFLFIPYSCTRICYIMYIKLHGEIISIPTIKN